jgi:pyrroline-5-carboxylate reductase
MAEMPLLAVIGVGTMAEAVVGLAIEKGWPRHRFILTHRRPERRAELENKLGGTVEADNIAAASRADAVLVGVRPQEFAGVLDTIRPVMRPGQLFISIAAALDITWLERHLPAGVAVIRAVPPPTSWIRAGYGLLSASQKATAAHRDAAERLFINTCAELRWLPDELIDAATSIGPAITPYACLLVDSAVKAGVELGMPEELARDLAHVGIEAAGLMIRRSGYSTSEIIDMIATREGLTWSSLHTMERDGFREAVRGGVRAMVARSIELRDEPVPAEMAGFER